MSNILISSAGRRVELLNLFKKTAVSILGKDAKVFASDCEPGLSPACQMADKSFKVPHCTAPDFAKDLLELSLSNNVKLIIPTIDTELLAFANIRASFLSAGIDVVVSDAGLIKQCSDKRLTAGLFSSLSIASPKILDPLKLTFPCFMKPVIGSASQGIRVIPSADHLSSFDKHNPNNLFQELIPDYWTEYTIDLYYSKIGRLLSCVPRERVSTRGGEISKGVTRKDQTLEFLKSRISILKGARGAITLQVFTNPSRELVLGIEVNPRFGGGYPISHIAGADYASNLIREYILGESLCYVESWEADVLMLRYDNMVRSYSR